MRASPSPQKKTSGRTPKFKKKTAVERMFISGWRDGARADPRDHCQRKPRQASSSSASCRSTLWATSSATSRVRPHRRLSVHRFVAGTASTAATTRPRPQTPPLINISTDRLAFIRPVSCTRRLTWDRDRLRRDYPELSRHWGAKASIERILPGYNHRLHLHFPGGGSPFGKPMGGGRFFAIYLFIISWQDW